MCEIYETRYNKSSGNVYIVLSDDVEFAVRRLTKEKFDFAKQFGNDFVGLVAKDTSDRNINDSYYSEPFEDPAIKYSIF